jgi:hypothetical protein
MVLNCGPVRLACCLGLARAVAVAVLATLCPALLSGTGAAAGTRVVAGARVVALQDGWGAAHRMPGFAALNRGTDAGLRGLSCVSAGNCVAGGSYSNAAEVGQAFVVSEVHGVWSRARQVPGTASALSPGAMVESVSCAAAGYCAAGGFYTDAAGLMQAFVVSERNGVWGRAREVPGTARLNQGGAASVAVVSCAPGGYCAAGGSYTDAAGNGQAFVVSENHGTWGTAVEVPGTASLNVGGGAEVDTLSCPSLGNCGAAGVYQDGGGGMQAFVTSQSHGRWHRAQEVPGTATLNHGWAVADQVSCPSAGNCGGGGLYLATGSKFEAFVVSEVNGTWGQAHEVPGSAALNRGGDASVYSLSCAAPGTCSAGGYYRDAARHQQAFTVSQDHGTWRTAHQVPGTAALNTGGEAQISLVSCASAGTCSAGGFYTGPSGIRHAFTVGQAGGTWGQAQQVPGLATLTHGGSSSINGLFCPSPGHCAAGGTFAVPGSHRAQIFVTAQAPRPGAHDDHVGVLCGHVPRRQHERAAVDAQRHDAARADTDPCRTEPEWRAETVTGLLAPLEMGFRLASYLEKARRPVVHDHRRFRHALSVAELLGASHVREIGVAADHEGL